MGLLVLRPARLQLPGATMSETAEIEAKLKDSPLFAEFTDLELHEFVSLVDVTRAKASDVVVRQDDFGDCMYILVKGTARVVHHKEGHYVDLARLKTGDFFGEIALVDHGPRSADVQAVDDCTLLRITVGDLSALAGIFPMAGFKYLIALGRILVDRLRRSNQRYVDSLIFPLPGKD